MKILCSGNPLQNVLASAVSKKYPDAKFVSRSNGYDLLTWTPETQKKFQEIVILSDVFINSSYIGPGVQKRLLEATVNHWMRADIKGHIITLGTTAEYDQASVHHDYKTSKRELRQTSLEFNEQTGITGVKTSYLIVGGVKSGNNYLEDFLELHTVVDTINWILHNPARIPLMQLESPK